MPDDPTVCCALEICCGGPQSKSKEAFAAWLEKHAALSKVDAARVSRAVLSEFALAPPEFASVATAIGKIAREHGEYNQ